MRRLSLALFSIGLVVATFGAAAPSTQRTLMKNPSVYAYAVCNTADIVALVSKGGPLQNAPVNAAKLIQARIAACKTIINQYIAGLSLAPIIARNPPGLPPLPTPAALTTTPPGCSVNVPGTNVTSYAPMRLYSALAYCANWIANNVPSPSASTPTPRPVGFHTPFYGSMGPHWRKAVYAMALASDAGVSAQISLQLADYLRAPPMHPDVAYGETPSPQPDIYSNRLVQYAVVAAPTWTLAQYQQQCFNDPSTAGAIIAVQPGVYSETFNAFFGQSRTVLNMQLMVVDCEPTNTSYTNNAAYITRLSHVRAKPGVRNNFNLATLLGALAFVYALHSPTTTTYSFRKPNPTPPPGGSFKSMYSVSSAGSLESTAALGFASALGSSAIVGDLPSTDSQTAGAVKGVLPGLIDDLMWSCTKMRTGDPSFPEPQCYWFSYRPATRPKP